MLYMHIMQLNRLCHIWQHIICSDWMCCWWLAVHSLSNDVLIQPQWLLQLHQFRGRGTSVSKSTYLRKGINLRGSLQKKGTKALITSEVTTSSTSTCRHAHTHICTNVARFLSLTQAHANSYTRGEDLSMSLHPVWQLSCPKVLNLSYETTSLHQTHCYRPNSCSHGRLCTAGEEIKQYTVKARRACMLSSFCKHATVQKPRKRTCDSW